MNLVLQIAGWTCFALGTLGFAYAQWIWADIEEHGLATKPKWMTKPWLIYFPQHLTREGRRLSGRFYRWLGLSVFSFLLGFGLLYISSGFQNIHFTL